MTATATAPFAPAGVDFKSVSMNLATHRIVLGAIWTGVPLIAGVILTAIFSLWWLFLVVVPLVLFCWELWLAPRQTRALQYAEREDDLLIRWGILFRSMVVVPYGRMQFVDVTAGPLQRAFGIATVQLHTAAASTDASIEGLTPEVAEQLRDRLAARGQARLAGL